MITIKNTPCLSIGDKFYEVRWINIEEKTIEDITYVIEWCDASSKLCKKLWRKNWPITREWLKNPDRFFIKYFYWTSFHWGIEETDFWELSEEYKCEIKTRELFLNKEDAENQAMINGAGLKADLIEKMRLDEEELKKYDQFIANIPDRKRYTFSLFWLSITFEIK